MGKLKQRLLTLPEQSLQVMPPVPRHLWQAFTTPVRGTVTTRTSSCPYAAGVAPYIVGFPPPLPFPPPSHFQEKPSYALSICTSE